MASDPKRPIWMRGQMKKPRAPLKRGATNPLALRKGVSSHAIVNAQDVETHPALAKRDTDHLDRLKLRAKSTRLVLPEEHASAALPAPVVEWAQLVEIPAGKLVCCKVHGGQCLFWKFWVWQRRIEVWRLVCRFAL